MSPADFLFSGIFQGNASNSFVPVKAQNLNSVSENHENYPIDYNHGKKKSTIYKYTVNVNSLNQLPFTHQCSYIFPGNSRALQAPSGGKIRDLTV